MPPAAGTRTTSPLMSSSPLVRVRTADPSGAYDAPNRCVPSAAVSNGVPPNGSDTSVERSSSELFVASMSAVGETSKSKTCAASGATCVTTGWTPAATGAHRSATASITTLSPEKSTREPTPSSAVPSRLHLTSETEVASSPALPSPVV